MYLVLGRLVILAWAFLAQTCAHPWLNARVNLLEEETNLLKQDNLNQAVLITEQNDVIAQMKLDIFKRLEDLGMIQLENAFATANTKQDLEQYKSDTTLQVEVLKFDSAGQISEIHTRLTEIEIGSVVQQKQVDNRIETLKEKIVEQEGRTNETIAVIQSVLSEVSREMGESESGLREEIDSIKQNIVELRLNISRQFVEELERMREEIEEQTEEETDDETCDIWQLGMNLDTSDGHIMGYTTGWHDGVSIGSDSNALTGDYLSQAVWQKPANYIAIVRHQSVTVDAVKVFKFFTEGVSMYDRFNSNNAVYYRSIVTSGGHIQKSVAPGAPYMTDDPVFSVDGDLAFNWGYYDNGVRVALTEGHLSEPNVNDINTHGLGGNLACKPRTGVTPYGTLYAHDVSPIQDCALYSSCYSSNNYRVLGTDHGSYSPYNSVSDYGSYALYISQDASRFPEPGYVLQLEVEQCG